MKEALPYITLFFGSGAGLALIKYILHRIKKNDEKTDALCKGVQALLRDRMYQSYDRYTEKGYAPIYAKENFLNMYKPYHILGQNGVMDGKKDEFMALPDKPPKDDDK